MPYNALVSAATFVMLITINVICLRISNKCAAEIQLASIKEYQLHQCGRAIAGIRNFELFAKFAESQDLISREKSSETLQIIRFGLRRKLGNIFEISHEYCIDLDSSKEAAYVYLKDESNVSKDTPNYSYRFL